MTKPWQWIAAGAAWILIASLFSLVMLGASHLLGTELECIQAVRFGTPHLNTYDLCG